MGSEQPRYDLIPDLLPWLVRTGLVTEAQARRVSEKFLQVFAQGPGPLRELLLSEGVSVDPIDQALHSLNLLDPVPLDRNSAGSGVSPITRLISMILGTALAASAAALEFQPSGRTTRVRYRIEGIWYDMETFPGHLTDPLLDRLRELTSQGRLLVRLDGKPLDLIVDSEQPSFRLRVQPAIS
jgi:hypothetical protein